MSKRYNVYLDAGHGKHTPNKCTPDGISEWELNDKVCKYIKANLEKYNCDVFRCDDVTGEVNIIPVSNRLKTADIGKADVCISIHHGLYGDGTYEDGNNHPGVATYYGVEHSEASETLAKNILNNLIANTGLVSKGYSEANMMMCKKKAYPTVLVEGGVMNNKSDHDYIITDKGQKAYAKSVSSAIILYLGLEKDYSSDNLNSSVNNSRTYTVAESFNSKDTKLQYSVLGAAITECDKHCNYNVYDETGNVLHKSSYALTVPVNEVKVMHETGLQMRKEPSNTSATIYTASNREKLVLLDTYREPYWHCRTKDGIYDGYMFSGFLRRL